MRSDHQRARGWRTPSAAPRIEKGLTRMDRLNRIGYELMTIAATGELEREDGQTMAEYGLILTGIALVVMVTTLLLGNAISASFTAIINKL